MDPYWDSYLRLAFDFEKNICNEVGGSNRLGFATAVGTPTLSNTVVKTGANSGYFSGASGIKTFKAEGSVSIFRNLNIGTQDFTCEGWVYPTSYSVNTYNGILIIGAVSEMCFGLYSDGRLRCGATTNSVYSNTAIPLNAWSYVSYSKTGGRLYLHINGQLQYNSTNTQTYGSTSTTATTTAYVGGQTGSNEAFTGYIDNLKYYIGVGKYTSSSYTPPTLFETNNRPFFDFVQARNPVYWYRMHDPYYSSSYLINSAYTYAQTTPGANLLIGATAEVTLTNASIATNGETYAKSIHLSGATNAVGSVPYVSRMGTTNNTVFMVVKPDTISNNPMIHATGNHTLTGSRGIRLRILAAGSIAVYWYNGTTQMSQASTATGLVTAGVPATISYTTDRTTYIRGYVNGQPALQATLTGTVDAGGGTQAHTIGAQYVGSSTYSLQLTGYIQDVVYLDSVLTDSEMLYMHNTIMSSAVTLSGTVTGADSSPVIRNVRAYLRSTGAMVAETISASDGTYAIVSPFPGQEHYIVAVDDSTAPHWNLATRDKVIPT